MVVFVGCFFEKSVGEADLKVAEKVLAVELCSNEDKAAGRLSARRGFLEGEAPA
jgi:hypothetical protein